MRIHKSGLPCPRCGFVLDPDDPNYLNLLESVVARKKAEMNRRIAANRNKGCAVILIPLLAAGASLLVW